MDAREQSYWELHDFSVGTASTSARCTASSSGNDGGDVSYVDVFDREVIVRHYLDDPAVAVGEAPEIDSHLILSDVIILTLVEATKSGASFEWVMASKVIEHVPDWIDWLAELGTIVEDRGVLVLAIPDKRYCFDVHRPPTTVGQMVDTHAAGNQRPSVAAVYEYFSWVVDAESRKLWRRRMPTFDSRIHNLDEARNHVERGPGRRLRRLPRTDVHPCELPAADARAPGHRPLRVDRGAHGADPAPRLEFGVVMRRLPRDRATTGE